MKEILALGILGFLAWQIAQQPTAPVVQLAPMNPDPKPFAPTPGITAQQSPTVADEIVTTFPVRDNPVVLNTFQTYPADINHWNEATYQGSWINNLWNLNL